MDDKTEFKDNWEEIMKTMKKAITILLAVMFLMLLTTGSASALMELRSYIPYTDPSEIHKFSPIDDSVLGSGCIQDSSSPGSGGSTSLYSNSVPSPHLLTNYKD